MFFVFQMTMTNLNHPSGSVSRGSLSNSSSADGQTLYCLCQSNDCSTFMMYETKELTLKIYFHMRNF